MESKIEGLLSPEGAGGGHEYPREFHALGADSLVATRAATPGLPVERRFQSLRELATRLEREPALPLRALIFHCSRCGSTLLAQLLALEGSTRVFAEPQVLNKFLWTHAAQFARGEMHRELRAFVVAFGLSPAGGERGFAIKLSSSALLFLPTLRACFPQVPFVYLLRNPGEVVASISAQPPLFLQEENRSTFARAWGGDPAVVQPLSAVEWYAWYVDRNLRLALQHASNFSEAIDHAQSGTRFLAWVNRLTSAQLSPDRANVAGLLARHSKSPHRPYRPETAGPLDVATRVMSIAGEAYQLWRERLAHSAQPR